MYNYVQIVGGEEEWQPVPNSRLSTLLDEKHPMFVTVLAVSQLITESTTKEDFDKLTYLGPMYFDWDGADVAQVTQDTITFVEKLEALGVNPESLHLYATGGKGYHCEIPQEVWVDKVPKSGFSLLPLVFKEIALQLAVDTLDLRVYSTRRGRMWRQPNVQRPNGRYKVPITWTELQAMTPERYVELTSSARPAVRRASPDYALKLAMLFDEKQQKVSNLVAKRKKQKRQPTNLRSDMPSLVALCEGRGIKPGTGFNELALQLSTLAVTLGWTEQQLVEKCAGLIENHESDGSRYDTPAKRRADLVRMFRYMEDNPCYEASIGGIKSVLAHSAPDIQGIPVAKEDVEADIAEAADRAGSEDSDPDTPDEYAGLTGVTLNKYGVYVPTEAGPKRVCAITFGDVETLKSMETGVILTIEADIIVNGRRMVRQCLELDVFSSVQSFNKFATRFGHAFQGSDANVRGVYMSVVESAKRSGKEVFVTSREGLDIVSIPNHENELLREPFMLWADNKGVALEPKVAEAGLQIRFQGYPDSRGQFKIDLSDAPSLTAVMKDDEQKALLADAIEGMLNCQRPDVISKMLGWTTACFFRMLFHKVYGKFPLLHVNAPAGTGKSEMSAACLNFFYYNQEPRILSPSSTVFALSYGASGSVTPPLMIDEYKPHRMNEVTRERIKAMLRDAYNAREQQRGGGTRDNDDYRSIHSTTLSAPVWFIAEAMEEESAIMERVVLVTISKPHPAQASKDYAQFQRWQRNGRLLASVGQYIAAGVVRNYSLGRLQKEFDELYEAARARFMLTDSDLKNPELTKDALQAKQNTKERSVYNYTVAYFGLSKLCEVLKGAFPGRFDAQLDKLLESVYVRLDDLAATTQPEWLKVFNTFGDMSNLEGPTALVVNRDYAISEHGGRTVLELYARMAYGKYRAYCRSSGLPPLYPGDTAFIHGVRDCQAYVPDASNVKLAVPGGSMCFDMDRLLAAGFRGIKAK